MNFLTLKKFSGIIFAAIVLVVGVAAQDLPKKIRGYKVHDEILTVTTDNSSKRGTPQVTVEEPTVLDVSLSGLTLAVTGQLEAAGYDGRVEMMTFHDFRVNNIAVEVKEFDTPFSVSKLGKTKLPAPATVFLPTANILKAAWTEITDSQNNWTVTGRVFVFGKFKKFGFNFKRVVPVDVRLVMKNPLLEYRKPAVS